MLRLCLDFLTALSASPPELVSLAGANDCRLVSLHLQAAAEGEASLIGDTAMRRETLLRCRDLGVAVDMVEGFVLKPGASDEAVEPMLAAGAALGARGANVVLRGDEVGAVTDQAGRLCELAAGYGLATWFEFSRRVAIKTLPEAAAVVRALGAADAKILIDTLHFFRFGGAVSDLAACRDLIGRAQLSDGPLVMADEAQFDEAYYERMVPGEGALPLLGLLRELPGGVTVGAEVPLRSWEAQGVSVEERVRRVLAASAAMLAEV
jgi:sugar phosphate isomerase/epimerase